MNLVDSSGWLEYFADAPNADFFVVPIEDVNNLIVPTLCNMGTLVQREIRLDIG